MNHSIIKKYNNIIILFVLFLSFLGITYLFNTNFFSIETSYETIENGDYQLQGLLYKPSSATNENQRPGVVLAHGIANSKEVVSGIALELAKKGFVCLSLDESAHGNSGGLFRNRMDDLSLGVSSAVNWLNGRNFVLDNSIGVIGHSMGAGSVREASVNSTIIKSTILIGGGVNDLLNDTKGYNTTNPHNLLVIIGQFDVLFNLELVQDSNLMDIFNTTSIIEKNVLYGSFQHLSARKLVTVPATHLFEVENTEAISIMVNWLSNSLEFTPTSTDNDYSTFLFRDVFLIFATFSFIVLIILLSKGIYERFSNQEQQNLDESIVKRGNPYVLGATWGILSLLLFLPSQVIGSIIIFPPLIFGSFFSIWLAITGIIGIIALKIFQKSNSVSFSLKATINRIFKQKQSVIFAIVIFTIIYLSVIIIESFFKLNFKFFVPFINEIGSIDRIIIFFIVLPYTLVYFFAENLFFNELSDYKEFNSVKTLFTQLFLKLTPFIIVLIIFYFPILLFSVVVIPGQTGFFMEFLVPVVPIYIITTAFNWYYYAKFKDFIPGLIINALLVTLTISSLFPVF
jgi:dienelactone hydrolase